MEKVKNLRLLIHMLCGTLGLRERQFGQPGKCLESSECMGQGKVGWLDFRRLNYHIKRFGFYSVDNGSHRSFLVRD